MSNNESWTSLAPFIAEKIPTIEYKSFGMTATTAENVMVGVKSTSYERTLRRPGGLHMRDT